ncbi:MAG TPA: TrkA family potassium uptake protein [Lactobacillaceae bacterium]|jgi:trk system potassium uptake protein TrkA
MKQTFAVLGLGRFGTALVKTLAANGQDVLGLDINEAHVNEVREIATQAIIADAKSEAVLRKIDIASFDHVIIAIGDNMQASILATINAKEIGAKHVIAKAEDKTHVRVLEKIGADVVIQPEREMGERIARQLLAPNMLNFITLSENYSLAEVKIANPKFYGKSLDTLKLRSRFGLNVIAVRNGKDITVSPEGDYILQANDVISVIGESDMVDDFDRRTNAE